MYRFYPQKVYYRWVSDSEVVCVQDQGEARVINVLIIHYLKIMIFFQICHYELLYASVQEGERWSL